MYNRSLYTVSFENAAFTLANGDYDFFELKAASDKPIEIVGLFIATTTEVGDAQEEQIRFGIGRNTGATFTSGNGTATTPRPLDEGAAAASFTAETVASAIATTTGTLVWLHQDTFNIRTGLQLWFPPEARIQASANANSAILIRMFSTLADDASMSGTVYVAEL
jgi:hypothetical protein